VSICSIISLQYSNKYWFNCTVIVAALQDELLLFQLPDVLPGVPFSKDSGQKTTNPDDTLVR